MIKKNIIRNLARCEVREVLQKTNSKTRYMANKESETYKAIKEARSQERRIAHASEALRKVLNEEIYNQGLPPDEVLTVLAHISASYIRQMQQDIYPNDKDYVEAHFQFIIEDLLNDWELKSPSTEAVKTDIEAN